MAFGQGRYARCANLLLPILPATLPMGGSHAQRSLLFLTTAEAARRAGDTALAQALASEAAARKAPAPRAMHAGQHAAEPALG